MKRDFSKRCSHLLFLLFLRGMSRRVNYTNWPLVLRTHAHIYCIYCTCCIRIITRIVQKSSRQALGAHASLPPRHLFIFYMKEILYALLMPSSLVLFAIINAYKTYCCQFTSHFTLLSFAFVKTIF